MILRATADTVRLDMDEHGWHLAIDTSDGDSLVVNIQDAAYELAGSAGLREALERLVADLETNSEMGAPDYAHKALEPGSEGE